MVFLLSPYLNNIRKKAVIDKIIDSILDIEPASKSIFQNQRKKLNNTLC